MKKVLLLIFLCTKVLIAQEVCESPEETIADLNSITKCTIEPVKKSNDKKSRQISVRVSASKRRFLKKKPQVEKRTATASINNLSTSGLSSIESSSEIENSLTLKEQTKETKRENAINDIAALTNSMSVEEVRSAEKFNTVDEIPLFKNCKNSDDNLECFNTEMMKHIQKHFSYPGEAIRTMTQGEVWVRFIIDKNGDIKNIKTLGPDNGELLNQEATRVVTKLSKFNPARKNGKYVAVKYGFPINFSLED